MLKTRVICSTYKKDNKIINYRIKVYPLQGLPPIGWFETFPTMESGMTEDDEEYIHRHSKQTILSFYALQGAHEYAMHIHRGQTHVIPMKPEIYYETNLHEPGIVHFAVGKAHVSIILHEDQIELEKAVGFEVRING